MNHGERLPGFDLIPAKGEREAPGQLLDATEALEPGAAAALLLLLQTQEELQQRGIGVKTWARLRSSRNFSMPSTQLST